MSATSGPFEPTAGAVTRLEQAVAAIRRTHESSYDDLVRRLSREGATPQAAADAVDQAFVEALRRPLAFRYHDDGPEWLLATARGHVRARGAEADPTRRRTPFETLLAQGRRIDRRRRTLSIALAVALLVVIAVWEVVWGPALQVPVTLRDVLGGGLAGAAPPRG